MHHIEESKLLWDDSSFLALNTSLKYHCSILLTVSQLGRSGPYKYLNNGLYCPNATMTTTDEHVIIQQSQCLGLTSCSTTKVMLDNS